MNLEDFSKITSNAKLESYKCLEDEAKHFFERIREFSQISIVFAVSPNYGHYANTIHLLRRILEYLPEPTQPIQLYYELQNDESQASKETVEKELKAQQEKLALLIPGFYPDPSGNPIEVKDCWHTNCTLICRKLSPIEKIDGEGGLILCGGQDINDENEGDEALTKYIHMGEPALYFVVQPYQWEFDNLLGGDRVGRQIKVKEEEEPQTLWRMPKIAAYAAKNKEYEIDSEVAGYAGPVDQQLRRMAFQFNEAELNYKLNSDWMAYMRGNYEALADKIPDLVSKQSIANGHICIEHKDEYRIFPVYGTHVFNQLQDEAEEEEEEENAQLLPDAQQLLFKLGCGWMDMMCATPNQRSAVIAHIGKAHTREELALFLWLMQIDFMKELVPPLCFAQEDGSWKPEYIWLQNVIIELSQKWRTSPKDVFVICPERQLDTVLKTVGNRTGKIIYAQIGPQPPYLFNALFYIAALPAVFEGQATTSLATSCRKPFLQVSTYVEASETYPELGQKGSPAPLITWLRTQINSGAGSDFETQVHALSRWMMDVDQTESDAYKYMNALFDRSSIKFPWRDKFVFAMAFAEQIMVKHTHSPTARRSGRDGGLDQLYRQLVQAAAAGSFVPYDLLPDTRFTALVQGMFPAFAVSAEADQISAVYDAETMTEIQLTGAQAQVEGDPFALDLTFFADGAAIVRLTAREPGSLPGVPWIRLEDWGVELYTTEHGIPLQSVLYGELHDLHLKLRIMQFDDLCTLTGTFDPPQSALEPVFCLLGSVQFTALFPDVLRKLPVAVQDIELQYLSESETLVAALLTLTAQEEWQLCSCPPISFTPALTVYIDGLQQAEGWSLGFDLTGTFRIDDAVLTVRGTYPHFAVAVTLSENKLDLARLIGMIDPALSGLPDTALSAFNMYLSPEADQYSLSAALETAWTLLPGFEIAGVALQVEKAQNDISLWFAGTFQLLDALDVSVSVQYRTGEGWVAEGALAEGEAPNVSDLLAQYGPPQLSAQAIPFDFALPRLTVRFASQTGQWMFRAETDQPWTLPFLDKPLAASFAIGTLDLHAGAADAAINAVLEAETDLLGIEKIWYDYCGGQGTMSFGILWCGITALVQKDEKGEYTAAITFADDFTLGRLLETMVSWVTSRPFELKSPWDILDKIALGGSRLAYNLTTGHMTAEIAFAPIELGFARIDAVALSFDSDKGKVNLSLEGSFRWQEDPEQPLGWDVANPDETPIPPDAGNAYFSMPLLALGQHVAPVGLAEADDVLAMIKVLESMAESGAHLPDVEVSPDIDWLFGAELALLWQKEENPPCYMITARAVLCDPRLYALRLDVKGARALIFDGLMVEIIYRRLSDALGVFEGRIILPDRMRFLHIGPYALTLPVLAAWIYTNGDFMVDLGFPHDRDFSVSFALSGMIAGGLQVTGQAGLYFGKLSSATAGDLVPQSPNGYFSPVIAFGFGLQVGFGKELNCGILRAGFSVTLTAILEGVIAQWHGYTAMLPAGKADALEDTYFYRISGVAGVTGHLYGSIDFAIIKADVDVLAELFVEFVFETRKPVLLTVSVSVDVKLRITIDLWLFSIHLNLSFSLRLREEFTLGEAQPCPWDGADRVLLPPRKAFAPLALHFAADCGAAQRTDLACYLMLSPALAYDEWGTGEQVPCLVAGLYLDALPGEAQPLTDCRKACGQEPLSAFETLCTRLAAWLIDAAALPDDTVSDGMLQGLLAALTSTDANPTPIPPAAAEAFLRDNFRFVIDTDVLAQGTNDEVNGTFFPLPGSFAVGLGTQKPCALHDCTSISGEGLRSLRAYFEALRVRVEEEGKQDAACAQETLSVADWVFADTFLLLARQLAQSMRDTLAAFAYPLQPDERVGDMLDWVGAQTGTQCRLSDLMRWNPTHPLRAGCTLVYPDGTYTVQAGDTPERVQCACGLTYADFDQPENDGVRGLFAADDLPTLCLCDLPQMRLGALTAGMQRAGAYQQLSGMLSRYLLSGLRLPTEGIAPTAPSMWTHANPDGSLCLPPEAGLFALTGQQLPLPADWSAFSATFVSGGDWLRFRVQGQETDRWTVTLKESDTARLTALVQAGRTPGCLPEARLTPDAMFAETPIRFQPTADTGCTVAGGFVLPQGGAPAAGLVLWKLPRAWGGAGRYALCFARRSPGAGTIDRLPADRHAWCVRVTVRVRRSADSLYEITRVDDPDRHLEAIVTAGAEQVAAVLPLRADARGAWQADDPAKIAFCIVRGNLSTTTHPADGMRSAPTGRMDTAEAFCRLLWQTAVTNSGGFYFYYYNPDDPAHGLPDSAFDADGTAQLSILLLLDGQTDAAGADWVPDHADTLLTADPLPEGAFVLAESADGRAESRPTAAPGTVTLTAALTPPDLQARLSDAQTEAQAFLRHTCNLLACRIAEESGGYAASVDSAPYAPRGTDVWTYLVSLPYARYAVGGEGSPYAGIGRPLSVRSRWQDLYGNLFDGSAGTLTLTPGYADLLLGPAAWPGVTVDWQVEADAAGQATLCLTLAFTPGADPAQAEACAQWCANAGQTYSRVYDQLNDPNGVVCTVACTLYQADAQPQPLDLAQLRSWLFGPSGSVRQYLEKAGRGALPAPCVFRFALPQTACTRAAMTVLETELQLSRCRTLCMPGAHTPASLLQSTLTVPPRTDDAGADTPRSYAAFAAALEAALPGLRVFAGADTTQQPRLFAVRQTADGIAFTLHEAPALYAVRPLSNHLCASGSPVKLPSWSDETGLTPQTHETTFADVDLDVWLSSLLDAVDTVLCAPLIGGIRVLDAACGSHHIDALCARKQELAGRLAGLLCPISGTAEPAAQARARELLRQELLQKLGNLNHVPAVAVFSADVRSALPAEPAVRLYSRVDWRQSAGEAVPLGFESGKLPVSQSGSAVPMPVLVRADSLVRDTSGAVVASVCGDLSLSADQIEYDVRAVAGAEGYERSEWLTPVTQRADDPFVQRAHDLMFPFLLREFPEAPDLTEQGEAESMAGGTLSDLIRWNYRFDFTRTHSYPQDTCVCLIAHEALARSAMQEDLLAALARFRAVWPALEASLQAACAALTPDADAQHLAAAAQAVQAFETLLDDVCAAFPDTALHSPASGYEFTLRQAVDDVDGQPAFAVYLYGAQPTFCKRIVAELDAAHYQAVPRPTQGLADCIAHYIYTDSDGHVMTPEEGQRILTQTLVLEGLTLTETQAVHAGMRIVRNRDVVPGLTVDESFIYQTGAVYFPSPFYMAREIDETIDLAQFAPEGTLEDRFEGLFAALFGQAPQQVELQMEACFAYAALDPDAAPVQIPAFLQPLCAVDSREIRPIAARWRAAIEAERRPPDSWLHFDLAFIHPKQQRTFLRLRNLIAT